MEENCSSLVPGQYELFEETAEQELYVNAERSINASLATYLYQKHVEEIRQFAEALPVPLEIEGADLGLYWSSEGMEFQWALLRTGRFVVMIRTTEDLQSGKALSAVKEMMEKLAVSY